MGKDLNFEKIVTDELIRLGMPRSLLGFTYSKYAILLCITDPTQIQHITKGLYPCIALKFNTNSSRVERAIRHAIGVTYSKGNIEEIQRIFGNMIYSKNKKPSNKEFIASVADEIRLYFQYN